MAHSSTQGQQDLQDLSLQDRQRPDWSKISGSFCTTNEEFPTARFGVPESTQPCRQETPSAACERCAQGSVDHARPTTQFATLGSCKKGKCPDCRSYYYSCPNEILDRGLDQAMVEKDGSGAQWPSTGNREIHDSCAHGDGGEFAYISNSDAARCNHSDQKLQRHLHILDSENFVKEACFSSTDVAKKDSTKQWWLTLQFVFTVAATGFIFYRVYAMGFFRWIPCYVAGVSTLWTRSNAVVISPDGSISGQQQSLEPFALQPIPLGTIRPRGWLADQLNLMGDGLAGHQHTFYRFIADSPWVGGNSEYSLLHEAFPYWLNGIVPLAYSIDKPELAKRLQDAVEDNVKKVLERQASDGWLGPETMDSGTRNLWGRMPLLLAFVQLLEADMPRYNTTLLPGVRKYMDLAHYMLKHQDGFGYLHPPDGGYKHGSNLSDVISEEDHGWGQVRAADMMISLQWLYENDDLSSKDKLWEMMQMLRLKDHDSLDWARWFTHHEKELSEPEFRKTPDATNKKLFAFTHGVNVGQGLKAGAVINRFERNQTMVALARKATEITFKYHGSASGSILADEQLEGLSPFYGSELCTTVETMYSLAYLYHSLGDNDFADRAERAAFNALPAAVMGDWWSHQYVTQPNQPTSSTMNRRPFWNVNQRGQSFGLEPDYPCCTVNHPQGYPKFLSHSWATVADNGIAHALLSPSAVQMKLAGGANVKVEAVTDYPFSDSLHYRASSDKPFTLYVRIPGWSDLESTIFSVNGVQATTIPNPDPHTGLFALPMPAGSSTAEVVLSRTVHTMKRMNDAESVFYGPLLYTLDVGYAAEHHHPPRNFGDSGTAQDHVPEKCVDWDIHNTSPWNMAVDFASLRPRDIRAASEPLPTEVWSRNGPPTVLEGTGCEIHWPLLYEDPAGGAGMPGAVPIDTTCLGGPKRVRFIAAGSAKVGMMELPRLQRSVKAHKFFNGTANTQAKMNGGTDVKEHVLGAE